MTVSHPVDDQGRVFCVTLRKTVDVIACYGCKKVVTIDLDSRHPRVTCALDATDERDERSR